MPSRMRVERRLVVLGRRRDAAARPRRTSRRTGGRSPRRSARCRVCAASAADGRVVEAEVQDRVHHPGHRRRRARAHRRRAAGRRRRRTSSVVSSSTLRERLVDLGVELVGIAAAPCAITWRQTSVVIVNPGGTGRPSDVISARLAPLPPSSALSFARPSACRRRTDGPTSRRPLPAAGSLRSSCTGR